MLNWMGGQKPHESDVDPDTTACGDQPNTPAPVFAVRAFKHAIFGTPQTVKPKPPRRYSNTETTRIRQNGRPRVERPKSSNDTQTLGKIDFALEDEPLPSPTKGILLTPGTATTRRKTVSFGDGVVDNETKKTSKSGLPDDCPGKFPSPWVQTIADSDNGSEPTEKLRGRNKLIEALEQAREESAQKKSKSARSSKPLDDGDDTVDIAEPRSDSGNYWKQEYDIYREKTTREVRKLVEKQKSAKNFARQKDHENTELREQLRQERNMVERLEKRAADLEAQLIRFQGKLLEANAAQSSRPEIRVARTDAATLGRPSAQVDSAMNRKHPARPERRAWRSQAAQEAAPAITETSAAFAGLDLDEPQAKVEEAVYIKPRVKPHNINTRLQDNMLAQPLASSTFDPTSIEPAQTSPRMGRPVTNDTDTAPLKALSVNTLQEKTRDVALSMGLQPPSPEQERRQDSPLRSPILPSSRQPTAKSPTLEDTTIPVPESSSFQLEAISERPNILTGAPVPIKATLRPSSKPPDVKENVSPTFKAPQLRTLENTKPSDRWKAMTAQAEQRRIVSKDGKELDPERAERAKARLAARGREVS